MTFDDVIINHPIRNNSVLSSTGTLMMNRVYDTLEQDVTLFTCDETERYAKHLFDNNWFKKGVDKTL
jgi:hypothetical protein